jgi:CPA2 family monovalent cation:H+ antiporter-2
MGMAPGLLPVEGNNRILAVAPITIMLNPVLFAAIEPLRPRIVNCQQLVQVTEH